MTLPSIAAVQEFLRNLGNTPTIPLFIFTLVVVATTLLAMSRPLTVIRALICIAMFGFVMLVSWQSEWRDLVPNDVLYIVIANTSIELLATFAGEVVKIVIILLLAILLGVKNLTFERGLILGLLGFVLFVAGCLLMVATEPSTGYRMPAGIAQRHYPLLNDLGVELNATPVGFLPVILWYYLRDTWQSPAAFMVKVAKWLILIVLIVVGGALLIYLFNALPRSMFQVTWPTALFGGLVAAIILDTIVKPTDKIWKPGIGVFLFVFSIGLMVFDLTDRYPLTVFALSSELISWLVTILVGNMIFSLE
ncbi:MAG: hypothetical protein KC547_05235 [Anaerolineae bacterium]|nr:hypothetical protein [Anaerolineae bacterium]